ncbi:MAG: sugar ABC transporter permease [Bacilli bacterium]|jgi:arabinogalactan oligomer/maltooligosaccharide transport system permease protein|nr:sugar ABC transporter permease [Bacilli bacterium]
MESPKDDKNKASENFTFNEKEEVAVENPVAQKSNFAYSMNKMWTKFAHAFVAFWVDFHHGFVNGCIAIYKAFIKFAKGYGEGFIKGNWSTKVSYLIFGFGYWFNGQKVVLKHHFGPQKGQPYLNKNGKEITYYQIQWLRALLLLAFQVGIIVLFIVWGLPNLSKLNLQNLVQYADSCVYNPATGKKECLNYDNSFLILLYSIVMLIVIACYFVIYFKQCKGVYESQKKVAASRHVNSALDDIKDMFDAKFYKTLLFVPIVGVVLFTIVPILFMVCIAFTNYDVNHMPPTYTFNWVGWTNFADLFNSSSSTNFNVVFPSILGWTIEWAVIATITCYLGGLLLALLLNSKRTRIRKFWRTCFVITIAVPQFVSLMLIRYFLSDNGIVNSLLSQWGVTEWAKGIGLISGSYFPFLSNPTWIKWFVIIINMWIGFPYMMLITTGILMNIPTDLYESAQIDGAGKSRMFWSITMPYILQVTSSYLISSFVGNINNFNVIYLLTAGYSTDNVIYGSVSAKETDLLVTWLFNMIQGNGYKYYMASVIGIMMFIISAIVTLLTFTQTTKGHREERFQ